jgi:hypothetical protein
MSTRAFKRILQRKPSTLSTHASYPCVRKDSLDVLGCRPLLCKAVGLPLCGAAAIADTCGTSTLVAMLRSINHVTQCVALFLWHVPWGAGRRAVHPHHLQSCWVLQSRRRPVMPDVMIPHNLISRSTPVQQSVRRSGQWRCTKPVVEKRTYSHDCAMLRSCEPHTGGNAMPLKCSYDIARSGISSPAQEQLDVVRPQAHGIAARSLPQRDDNGQQADQG